MMNDPALREAEQRARRSALATLLLAVALLGMGLAMMAGRSVSSGTSRAGDSAMGRTLNVNEANRPTLCLLPGIGPRLAERIITTRRRIGPIGDLQQLQQVRGIGPGIARDIAPHVRFERSTSPRTHARNDSPGQLNISLPTDDP